MHETRLNDFSSVFQGFLARKHGQKLTSAIPHLVSREKSDMVTGEFRRYMRPISGKELV